MGFKIFILLSRVPYPLEKGDKLRAYNQIKHLSKNHNIILCALNDIKLHPEAIQNLKPFCKNIHIIKLTKFQSIINIIKTFFNGKPFQIGYFYSNRIQRKIDALISETKPDFLYCQLIRVSEYLKKFPIPKTIDYQDVFSKGVERRKKAAPFYFKPILHLEYKRLLKYERYIFDKFDNKIIISKPDRDLIPHEKRENIHIIPNGVDMNYYIPKNIKKEYELLFTGNMSYPPNIHSAEFLVRKILPVVHQTHPYVKLMIAGASPHMRVLALKSKNIHVTGWVDDMRDCYAKAKIQIAPMLIGIGLQNKLLEAMAMKIPCITSQLANDALNARNGLEILVGNNVEEYYQHIVTLLEDDENAKQLADNAYKFIINNFNWESSIKKLETIITNC